MGSLSLPVRAQVSASGTGLTGSYFNNTALSGSPVVTRTDAQVNFSWSTGSPDKNIGVDKFSARWTGYIEAPVSGDVVFQTVADDGARLWINNVLVVDGWTSKTSSTPGSLLPLPILGTGSVTTTTTSAPITLKAGKRYPIRLEYYENVQSASVQLQWSYTGQALQVIPSKYLYNTASSGVPLNLTAQGYWSDKCCNNQPMAHIELAWDAVSGAKSYNLYRNGVLYQSGLTMIAYKDMAVMSGHLYGYTVTAVTTTGESDQSLPAVADAPFPLNGSGSDIPTNLRVNGAQITGTTNTTDLLTWSAAAGAKSYNVYQYDVVLASGVTDTKFLVPVPKFVYGVPYSITAVDATGQESLPSNIATGVGAVTPGTNPVVTPPVTPQALTAIPEWNAGAPRIMLSWQGHYANDTYNVYRDGVLKATGVWGLTYLDQDVRAGEVHTYKVSGSVKGYPTESVAGSTVTATAPASSAASAALSIQVTKTVANDDSVQVFFSSVAGARDYRVYNARNPQSVKYSAGGLSVEMNGIDPIDGADLIVEAVDKPGPFQKMDGMMGPGSTHNHMGMTEMTMTVNGTGDPSNVPNVLARSSVFHVDCQPVTLKGAQVFFDTFRNSKPFTAATVNPLISAAVSREVRAVENDKWTIYNFAGDYINSSVFVMSNHFMDTLYDGGSIGSPVPLHNNNASLVMSPKATADISKGKVLHTTFEVDPHFDGRRWLEVYVTAAGDPIIHPGKLDGGLSPTQSGTMFVWNIQAQNNETGLYRMSNGVSTYTTYDDPNESRAGRGGSNAALANGSMQDLDKRHKFDLYLSQTRLAILENGRVVRQVTLPANATLPFDKLQVSFVHQLYHTGNDRPELVTWLQNETYWINNRPWADERHWDNMGFEVLDSFPVL